MPLLGARAGSDFRVGFASAFPRREYRPVAALRKARFFRPVTEPTALPGAFDPTSLGSCVAGSTPGKR
jgi:hypothetical protein